MTPNLSLNLTFVGGTWCPPAGRRLAWFVRPYPTPMSATFREQWANAGYRSDCGSASVLPPPSREFVRAYHLTDAAFAISSIALCRLKLARFSDLNDPFELMAVNFREKRTRQIVRSFKNAYDSHTGLLCFSADWKNPVLWSHYGAKHRGVCLGFNLRRGSAQPVRYEDERLLAQLGENGDPDAIDQDLQDLLLCTKFRHWQYEEELRVFVPLESATREGSMYFCPFGKDLQLAEVILGPQCNLSVNTVQELTRSRHPEALVFESRLAFKYFAVVPANS